MEDFSPERLDSDIQALILKLKVARPDERSELSRRFAITITQLEIIEGYFRAYVVERGPEIDQ